ncbi:hypothetical protein BGZ61DRAFT_541382 [Ilyonectria robusta]|uniref:uncharacterized protein n=1 Tax=Ilyonectria robusta TaxID=1079257 RepID=UPI001E8DBD44|nr:uncharacterized protein BGZ61DRAFT_541382 [Ilyonectria robusta]KAH8654694.1 hypothetical protein BGZ61DRAFT_541382 [Ilyonectria robusta]
MAYGLNVTLSELPGGCPSLERSLNADHDEYDYWFSSSDAENEPLIKDPIQYCAAYIPVRVGDLDTRMQFNYFNSTLSIQFGDVVDQLHGPNAE